ncbi:protein-L-isoaspartate O-methyltransferase [Kitasatospora gansuensis]
MAYAAVDGLPDLPTVLASHPPGPANFRRAGPHPDWRRKTLRTNALGEPVEAQRRRMLAQMEGRVQLALSVRAAFENLERHLLLPGRSAADAYGPDPVPVVDAGDTEGCATTPPLVQGHLLNLAGVRLGQRVLLAGGAPGITASLLEHLVGPTGEVVALESSGMLAYRTRLMLAATGHDRVRVHHLDATGELPFAKGEFDVVVSAGSVPGIPPEWWRVLRVGGRMVLPLRIGGHCRITSFVREEDRLVAGEWVAYDVAPLRWKELPGGGADQLVPLADGRCSTSTARTRREPCWRPRRSPTCPAHGW